jgi:MinD-like ATPase involved in chromosome partitioning or flagellar assembly
VISVISPKGGVGKTTSTFLIGNVLSEYARMRVIAVDANPDFGTLAALAPDDARSDMSLLELLDNRDRLTGSAEFAPYLSRVPSGLHLAGAPRDAESMAALNPTLYRELVDFLARFYDVIILDCGTGITDPLAQLAVERSDQIVLVTTPDWITSQTVLGALHHLHAERSVVLLNQAHAGGADRAALEHVFMQQRLGTRVAVPYDERLRVMLDSASFDLDELERPVRVAIKQLTLAAAQQLR